MKLRYKIYLLFAVLIGVFCLGKCSNKKVSGPKLAPVLPVNDTEQIQVNPGKHTISILTRSGLKTETLPDRVSTIDVHKDGSVKITSKQFGFETRPFIGYIVSDQGRFAAGDDFWYYKRLDLGGGVAIQKDLASFVFFGKVSYNVWSNLSLGVTIDNQKHIGAMLNVRL